MTSKKDNRRNFLQIVAKADGLATIVMVLDKENGLTLLNPMDGCAGYLIDKKLNSYHTSNFFG
ncbi:hypothetical protein [Desulfosediminicola flagellatus]|uniref:hypothetical protein n=1 Tax=Desulfosediminicola flagellatus TaxID=2569541 RepID=UPI0010AB9DF9|nr:hypothetical protein [Desulfosediminicola flagellatus]